MGSRYFQDESSHMEMGTRHHFHVTRVKSRALPRALRDFLRSLMLPTTFFLYFTLLMNLSFHVFSSPRRVSTVKIPALNFGWSQQTRVTDGVGCVSMHWGMCLFVCIFLSQYLSVQICAAPNEWKTGSKVTAKFDGQVFATI